ncbi:heme exporter protein CcmD [Thalassotalea sp. 42_200_T64]|nr:heme exporter protein CcmD [Thalassotalea sp. 42_200_T64]
MQFESFSDFLNMGGYAFYVWLSFGLSAILLISLVISSNNNHKALLNKIAQQQSRENKLRKLAKQRQNDASSDVQEVVS